ncbi:uncharacterized protein LOC121776197 isoform X2 [Salvia splendens]|uniref:uncharacterized protein LOC121776197 isoform X2 n=1 Tax=Salvia splendens TaxID=180675 RepID=UPI001C26A09A|nr:uncharacterized protein LOC121776197 isoform X2 [Salvia splendens]
MLSIAQKWHLSSHPLPKISSVLNPSGEIKRTVLTPEGRTKLNPLPDREFYASPRFVKHVDEKFISNLRDLYGQILRPEMEILDLCSSWVSHLPDEVVYERVVGHGLNAQELARNPRLSYFFVKDLNKDQKLEMEDSTFHAVLCTVSVQYLQEPEKEKFMPETLAWEIRPIREIGDFKTTFKGICGGVSSAEAGRGVYSEL